MENENVLDSISDQYLAKKKRNRKIIFSLISFVVFALAIIIIVMSCVKVNIKPKFIDNAVRYEVTINSAEKLSLDKTSEEFDDFDKLFDEAFSYNYLTALFDGKLSGYTIKDENETNDNFYSDTKNNTGMSSALKSALGKNYVRVKFDEDKTVKYSNGKTYYTKYNTSLPLKFNELYFNINSSDETSKITFYLGTFGGAVNTVKITKITVEANAYSLYKFAAED